MTYIKRITLELDQELYERLTPLVGSRTLKAVVTEALEGWMAKEQGKK